MSLPVGAQRTLQAPRQSCARGLLEIKGFSHWKIETVWRSKPFYETDWFWQHLPLGKSKMKLLAWNCQSCLIHASHSVPHRVFFLEKHCIEAVARNYTADWNGETAWDWIQYSKIGELQKNPPSFAAEQAEIIMSSTANSPHCWKGLHNWFSLSTTVFPHSDAWN